MSDTPLVSVIICVYNAGEYLRPAVQSVLDQTYRNLEVVIVDDGSTDGCMDSIADLTDQRIRVFRQENHGKSVAMNLALERLNGEFYALSDADDFSHPHRIQKQVAAMRAHPDIAAVYCGHEIMVNGRRMAPTFHAKDADACRRDIEAYTMPAHDPTGMYRIAMVGDLRYDKSLRIAQGFDYMLRVGEQWPVMVLGDCLYTYRIHWQSVTKKDPDLRNKLVCEVLRHACERRGQVMASTFADHGQVPSKHAEMDNRLAAHFMESACDLKQAGRRLDAVKVGIDCARLHPLAFHYHKALIYALTPSWFVTGSRRHPA